MKQKLLILGITMSGAGTEKSFLAFASQLDYDKYDVDLLLAKKEGILYDMLPPQIHVIALEECADMFTLSGSEAISVIYNCFVKKNPATLFEIFPYAMQMVLHFKKRHTYTMRLWIKMMQKIPVPQAIADTEYDAAIAYWGDKTMFYMVDKIKAKKKIAWLHFDYSNPPRDDATYLPYFEKCDHIVTVSETVDQALRDKLPQIADRCVMMENINDRKMIWEMAMRGESFPDFGYEGKRILSIMRICHQKGADFIPHILRKLRDDGEEVRWYIVGTGTEADLTSLKEAAIDLGVADMLILLGVTKNPYTYLRDSDLFALPSRHEGKPISVEEAKMMYKPIVVSEYLSAREQLCDGKYGLICDIGVDGMYQGIKTMLHNTAMGDAFSERLAEVDFSNTDEMKKFYEMLD